MTLYVVDASVAVEYILRTPLGLSLAETLEDAGLAAPDLIDAEVVSVLRRAVLNQRLAEGRALMALEDLVQWPVERIPSRALAPLTWKYHQNRHCLRRLLRRGGGHPRSPSANRRRSPGESPRTRNHHPAHPNVLRAAKAGSLTDGASPGRS